MSYDLMVSDPIGVPRDRKHFVEWYREVMKWSDVHDYSDPDVTTRQLRGWYEAIQKSFPNMNGPGAPTDAELMLPGVEDRLAGYTIGHHVIYADFRWCVAEEAYAEVRRFAVAHQVGFYDVSGDESNGEIYFPGDQLRPASNGAWRDVAKQFKEMSKQ